MRILAAFSCRFGTLLKGVLALVFAGVLPTISLAQGGSQEYELKAAFVLNFLKFTIFPARTERSIYLVCVDGETPGLEALRTIDGERVGSHKVSVARSADLSDARQCDVRFVTDSTPGLTKVLRASLEGRGLTITENSKSCAESWHINLFFDDERRLRFEIDPDKAKQSGISFSSKLLSLAKVCPAQGENPSRVLKP